MHHYRGRENRERRGRNLLQTPQSSVYFGFSEPPRLPLGFTVHKRAAILPVSTRAVGFTTQAVFSKAHAIYRNIPLCTPWAFYRVSLGQLELKLQKQVIPTEAGQDKLFYRPQLDNDFEDLISYLPVKIGLMANLIHHVGNFEHKGSYYSVRPIDHPTLGILLSNLRNVVTCMANADTPVQIRREFYENNPLPYAEWSLPVEDDERRHRRIPAGTAVGNPNHPLLLNADQIMPPDYAAADLRADINTYNNFISNLVRKNSSMLSVECAVDYNANVHHCIFTSNYMGDLKNPYTFRPDVGDYANQPPIGNLDEFWSAATLDAKEMLVGAVDLVGEIPNAPVTNSALVLRCESMAIQRARHCYTALLTTILN